MLLKTPEYTLRAIAIEATILKSNSLHGPCAILLLVGLH